MNHILFLDIAERTIQRERKSRRKIPDFYIEVLTIKREWLSGNLSEKELLDKRKPFAKHPNTTLYMNSKIKKDERRYSTYLLLRIIDIATDVEHNEWADIIALAAYHATYHAKTKNWLLRAWYYLLEKIIPPYTEGVCSVAPFEPKAWEIGTQEYDWIDNRRNEIGVAIRDELSIKNSTINIEE